MTRKVADPVIEEIHRTREEISERLDGNIAAIAEDATRRQAASGSVGPSGVETKDA